MTFLEVVPFDTFFEVSLRNGLTRPKAVRGEGVKMVNMGEIFAHGRIRDIHMDRVPLSDQEKNGFLLNTGDLLFARQSLVLEGAGKCSIFLGDEDQVTFESHIIRARLDKNRANPAFFYYFFKSPLGRNAIKSIVEQVAAAGIRGSDLAKLNVPKIPLGTQNVIAHILSNLDEKIDINRKMNETLGAIAQAIFKAWFIDFEPVRAKIDGRWQRGQSLPGMSSELFDLFPDRLVNSELGALPEGWTITKIGSLVDTISDTYPLSTVSEVVFLNTGDIKEGRFLHCTKSSVESLPGQAKKSIKQNDILYSEIRPENKRFAYVHFDSSDHVVSTKLMVLRSNSSVDSLFTYFVLTQQQVVDFLQMMAESRSGTFPQITFNVLSQIEIVLPGSTLLNQFTDKILRPVFLRKLALDKEVDILVSLRDTLLPKLISGELRVEAAQRLVASSVP